MHEYELDAWANGKDILFRQWVENKKKWSGWKSFRKLCNSGACPPFPWDYPVSTEWKVKDD